MTPTAIIAQVVLPSAVMLALASIAYWLGAQ